MSKRHQTSTRRTAYRSTFREIVEATKSASAERTWQNAVLANSVAHCAVRGKQQAFDAKVANALRTAQLSALVNLSSESNIPTFGSIQYRGQRLHLPVGIVPVQLTQR
jgi:hypothetical protein